MKKQKLPKFKVGDVVNNSWGEGRIIYHISSDTYFYVDIQVGTGDLFYNPCRSAVGFTFMEQKFHKVGEVKKLDKLNEDLQKIIPRFTESFSFASDMFEDWIGKYDFNFKQKDV